jgi:hypothetical protein
MGKMPLRQRLSDFGHKQFSDEYLRTILAFELISSGTLLFLAFQVLEYQRYYLSIVLFGLGWASAASALLFSIFPVGNASLRRTLELLTCAACIAATFYVMGVVKQAEREFYGARATSDVAVAKQTIENWNAAHKFAESPPAQIPQRPGHHSGEGFMKITEAAADPQKVIDVGAPLNFNLVATNTGQEAVTNVLMVSSFLPIGEVSEQFKAAKESDLITAFHKIRELSIAQQTKSGLQGEKIAPGETRINRVGTGRNAITEKDSQSFYSKKTKLYLFSWVSWKTLNGIKMQNEACVWLEPPNPPSPNPAQLWWNTCDAP